MAIKSGDIAPNFTLFNTQKQKVSLNDYRGKNLILLFFPFAFSSVCTNELCDVRDNLSEYINHDAEVIGISVDSLYTLAKYKADQQLNFTLLSDFNKIASKDYDVLYDVFPSYEMQGVSKRAAFVINREGIIRYAEVCEAPQHLPDFGAIQTLLSCLN